MAENTTASPFAMPYPSSTGEAKKGAADIQELAERVTAYLKERLTLVSEHGASFTAASGELVKATAAITVTLPAAAVNAVVELLSNGHEVTLGAGSALIYGDFITGTTPIKFVGYQHIKVVSDGTNWFITAGSSNYPVLQELGPAPSYLSWGRISESGGVEQGSGDYTLAAEGAGKYRISWKKEKPSNLYAVVVTLALGFGGEFEEWATVTETQPTYCLITTLTKTSGKNRPFSFIVMATS